MRGLPRSSWLLPSDPTSVTPLRCGVVERPVHRGDDHPLLRLVLGRVRRVVGAVVQPRVDVERHVDDVEADVGAVGQRVHHRLEEDVAAVLAATDLDERDVRRDTGEAGAVGSRADRAGDVRAVAESSQPIGSLQPRTRRAVDGRDVGHEVARPRRVEVGREVGVPGVQTGVEDADRHALVAGLHGARAVRAHHLQAPQLLVERVHAGRGGALELLVTGTGAALRGGRARCLVLDVVADHLGVRGCARWSAPWLRRGPRRTR